MDSRIFGPLTICGMLGYRLSRIHQRHMTCADGEAQPFIWNATSTWYQLPNRQIARTPYSPTAFQIKHLISVGTCTAPTPPVSTSHPFPLPFWGGDRHGRDNAPKNLSMVRVVGS